MKSRLEPAARTVPITAGLVADAASLLAALVGGWFAFGFGLQIGGVAMGAMTALCGAVATALLVSSTAETAGALLRRVIGKR